ncbi:MAG: hypothetical protein WA738_14455 [Candidatus Angelobacter sp.]
MQYQKFWVLVFCLCLLLPLTSAGQSRDVDKRDLRGISPQHHKYIFSVVGGAAFGAGLGYLLPGEKTPLKLMLIGGGGASTWFLHTHRATLGPLHDWGMIGSNTALGSGIGWLGCNCHDGWVGGALLGGGGTAVWEALKNDRAARNTFNSASGKSASDDSTTNK